MARKQKSSLPVSDTGDSSINTLAAENDEANADIVAANLRALQPIYFAAILEEARAFDVVERLVSMFANGMLPLGPERTGAMLYKYWKGDSKRLTTEQRR